MRCLVQALLVLSAGASALAQEAPEARRDDAALAQEAQRQVAALAAPTRAERMAAQEALLAIARDAGPLLDRIAPPPGFEAQAALDYVRSHRPRTPRQSIVPAGSYRVGSDSRIDQNPSREVTLARFTIDDVEVTCFEWWRFTRATSTAAPPDWIGGRYRYGGESLPVGNVSAEEAAQFAAWVGGRLPTADEWEVAAHGGSPRPYPWGDDFERRPTPFRGGVPPEVGSVPEDRSPFGGFDFCSSLMEWVRLPDGRVAARGGSFLNGNKEQLRLTRAPEAGPPRRRVTVGLRVADRKR